MALALLTACEGSLNLDISATPPEAVNAAVLRITGLSLERTDGTLLDIDLNPAVEIDALKLDRGAISTLLSAHELAAGDYAALSLRLSATTQTLDSYLEAADGGQAPLVLSAGSAATANQGFSIRQDETTSLTLHFDLRSSLLPASNAAGDRLIAPRLRLVELADSGSVSGRVADALLATGDCASDADPARGQVIYVYSGLDISPDDLDGISPDPLTTALITPSELNADYVVSFLPSGDYTLAISCDADLDDPDRDDSLSFVATRNVSITAGSTSSVHFDN